MRARTQHKIWRWLAVLALAAAVTVGQVAPAGSTDSSVYPAVADNEPMGPGNGGGTS